MLHYLTELFETFENHGECNISMHANTSKVMEGDVIYVHPYDRVRQRVLRGEKWDRHSRPAIYG